MVLGHLVIRFTNTIVSWLVYNREDQGKQKTRQVLCNGYLENRVKRKETITIIGNYTELAELWW